MSNIIIEVNHAYKSYGSLRAVNDLTFQVREGTCFSLLGPNGAGKTSMMKVLYGKAKPDNRKEMELQVFGFDPRHQELQIKSVSGVVPQEDSLDQELNVKQNLNIYANFFNLSKASRQKRIDYLLDFMELSEKKKVKIKELSGGMKRRLVIARALLNQPRLLFLDEPTTGLDPQVRQLIWDKLRSLKKEGVSILLTTHYMDEAFQLSDELIIMDKGKNVLQGNPRKLLSTDIEPHVLELIKPEFASEVEKKANGKPLRKEASQERVLYYSGDVAVLQRMSEGLDFGDYHLRPVNLEDLFLKATGRKLHEQQ
ncbi:MAG: ABC transporter ATP-binding protein [Spirochaetia bacterium]